MMIFFFPPLFQIPAVTVVYAVMASTVSRAPVCPGFVAADVSRT